jgi:hypothetical protein
MGYKIISDIKLNLSNREHYDAMISGSVRKCKCIKINQSYEGLPIKVGGTYFYYFENKEYCVFSNDWWVRPNFFETDFIDIALDRKQKLEKLNENR